MEFPLFAIGSHTVIIIDAVSYVRETLHNSRLTA